MRQLIWGLTLLAAAVASAGPHIQPRSAAQGRAWKALDREFEERVKPSEKALRAYAKKILRALQAGNIDYLVEESVMYSPGKDRVKLTREYFEQHKAELQAAAKLADAEAPDFAEHAEFESPEPEAGMPARAHIYFGPKVDPPPAAKRNAFPPRHRLDFYWSGPLMPEANGPVHETPPAGAKPGRWRFDQVTMPYSLTPVMRL
jgi:hypothetical protein